MNQPLEKLAAERDRFLAFAFASGDLLIETDRSGRVLYSAGAVAELLGGDTRAIRGRALGELFDPPSRALLNALLRQVEKGGRGGPITLTARESDKTLGLRAFCPDPATGRIYCLAFRHTGAQAAGSATPSGLPGTDAFAAAAQRHLAEARHSGAGSNMLLIDLGLPDGADASGDLQRSVGRLLRSAAQDADGAAQLGEGRFGLLPPEDTLPGDILADLEAAVAQTLPEAAGAIRANALDLGDTTLSEGDSIRALLYCINGYADGRPSAVSVTSLADGLRAEIQDTAARVGEMRSMLRDRAVALRFQPIVRLASREVVHFEALARTTSGDSAFEIITFAEKLGLSEELDALVFRLVLDTLTAARDEGMAPKVAVNLSARSVESEIFVQVIDQLQRSSPIPPHQILFEITETSQIADLERTARIIAALKAKGHQICIDDFGVGATTFDYLRRLPVDVLKIDGSYVQRLASEPREAHFVKVMATLCNGLGVETVAEMVEREDTARQLEYLGVTFGQGYLFGHPAETIEGPDAPARVQRAR